MNNVAHRKLNPDTVTHLSTNRARRWLTSLIKANALTTTPYGVPWYGKNTVINEQSIEKYRNLNSNDSL